MTGFNLPDGVTEAMIPGNRPEDELWDNIIEKIDQHDLLDEHFDHVEECEHAQWSDEKPSVEPVFMSCARGCIRVNVEARHGVEAVGDPLDCPHVEDLAQQRFDIRD